MANIGLLTVASQHDVANCFIGEINSVLRRSGHNTLLIGSWENLLSLAHFNPDWLLSINGVALELSIGDQPLPQAFEAKHLSVTIDNPLEFAYRWERAGAGLVTVADAGISSRMSETWPHLDVAYMPHGACGGIGPDPRHDRPIDVLVTGTYAPPAPQDFSPATQAWLGAHLASDLSPWHARAASPSDLVAQSCAQEYLEKQVRFRRRTALLSELTDAGICATLVGSGWENHPDACRHTILGPKPFLEVIKLFGLSKVVTHVAASIDSHERPLTAMLQGAALVVPAAPFWMGYFPDCTEDARTLLDCPDRRCALAASCQEDVALNHTWQERFRNFQW